MFTRSEVGLTGLLYPELSKGLDPTASGLAKYVMILSFGTWIKYDLKCNWS